MRIFVTRAYKRLDVAGKLSDSDLIAVVSEMNDGLRGVNLGGRVYKKRVALTGRGKSGGARTLVAFEKNERAIFLYGFSKNQRDNITNKEKRALKLLARDLLSYGDHLLIKALRHGALIEVKVRNHE